MRVQLALETGGDLPSGPGDTLGGVTVALLDELARGLEPLAARGDSVQLPDHIQSGSSLTRSTVEFPGSDVEECLRCWPSHQLCRTAVGARTGDRCGLYNPAP
jgi:hypothetical protein